MVGRGRAGREPVELECAYVEQSAMLGEGNIHIYGTVQISHTMHEGHQRLQCLPFPDKTYYGFNQDDFVFTRQPGVERFVLSPESPPRQRVVWSVASEAPFHSILPY